MINLNVRNKAISLLEERPHGGEWTVSSVPRSIFYDLLGHVLDECIEYDTVAPNGNEWCVGPQLCQDMLMGMV